MDPDDHGYYTTVLYGEVYTTGTCTMQIPIAYASRIPELLNNLDAEFSDDEFSLALSAKDPGEYKVLPFDSERANEPGYIWISFQGQINGSIHGYIRDIEEIDAKYLGIDWMDLEEYVLDSSEEYLYIVFTTDEDVEVSDWYTETYWMD